MSTTYIEICLPKQLYCFCKSARDWNVFLWSYTILILASLIIALTSINYISFRNLYVTCNRKKGFLEITKELYLVNGQMSAVQLKIFTLLVIIGYKTCFSPPLQNPKVVIHFILF